MWQYTGLGYNHCFYFKKRFITWSGSIIEDGVFFSRRRNDLICGVLRNNKREGFGFELKDSGAIICACYQKDKLINSFELPLHLQTRNPQVRQRVAAYLLNKANPMAQNCTDRPFTVALARSLDKAVSIDPHLSALQCVRKHNRFVDYVRSRQHIRDW